MASSVRDLFQAAGVPCESMVRWGEPLPLNSPGVYVVALTDDPDRRDATSVGSALESGRIHTLLARHADLKLDGVRPDDATLQGRVASFWIGTETVLYVGKASTSVKRRVDQYYRTELGALSPHAGGWFVKLTSHALFVHFGPSFEPESSEYAMVEAFNLGLSEESRHWLHDPERPMPFANLEWPRGTRKRHGITGATGRLGVDPPVVRPLDAPPPGGSSRRVIGARLDGRTLTTQTVTEMDIESGRIRLPHTAKRLFPKIKEDVTVRLRGQKVEAGWDPRMGPDRERSGVLSTSRAILALKLSAGERLRIVRTSDGVMLV